MSESISFRQYYGIVKKEAKEEATWAKDNLVVSLLLAALVALLGYLLTRQSPNWNSVTATCWVFGSVLLIYAIVIFWRAAWKLHQRQCVQIENLESYKHSVENREVRLTLVSCDYLPDVKHLGEDHQVIETSNSVSVTFGNPREEGIPGKIADDVLANVRFTDATRTFEHVGRWNQLDQPGGRDYAESTLDLERITFRPGDRRGLDIATQFADGLFAYNNESQGPSGAHREDKKLVGERILVTVELIATHVRQTFEFEIRNPVGGPLAIVSRPRVRPVAP